MRTEYIGRIIDKPIVHEGKEEKGEKWERE